MILNIPCLTLLLVATTSTTSLQGLFTAIVNKPKIQNTPSNFCHANLKSGIEFQDLEKQVKFISETEVWDSKVEGRTEGVSGTVHEQKN